MTPSVAIVSAVGSVFVIAGMLAAGLWWLNRKDDA